MNPDDLLGTEAAAQYCGLPTTTFKYYVRKGVIAPAYRGPVLLFSRPDLDRFRSHPRRPRGRPRKPKPAPA